MNSSVRSSVSCAVAVAGVSVLVSAPAPLAVNSTARPPAIVLAAQVQRSAMPTALAPQPLALAAEQVNFHVALFVDFIVTGAQLGGRQVAIPGALLRDIETRTPLPVALSRAVQTFVEVELDAGRELVGFATQYVDFQLRFLANVLQAAVAVATAIPVAVAELATSTVSHFMPAPAIGPGEAPSVRAAQREARRVRHHHHRKRRACRFEGGVLLQVDRIHFPLRRRDERSALRAKSEATLRKAPPMSRRPSRRSATTATQLVRWTPGLPRKRRRPRMFRKPTTSTTAM